MKTVVTHDGSFHPDDVLAIATIKLFLGDEPIEIIRTRDEEQIQQADWVIDVGDEYAPERRRFDHHQNGIPARDNGISYAAFGLVWKEFGEQVCKSAKVAEQIERQLVQPVDAGDNGIALYTLNEYQVEPYQLFSVIDAFRPLWGNEHENDTAFLDAVEFAQQLLVRVIAHEQALLKVKAMVEAGYKAAEDKELLVFDDPVSRHMFSKYPEVRMIVHPVDISKQKWRAYTVPTGRVPFETRAKYPDEWSGLRDAELAAVSGIEDAVFCHKSQFLFVANSKESAVRAAQVVLGRE